MVIETEERKDLVFVVWLLFYIYIERDLYEQELREQENSIQ